MKSGLSAAEIEGIRIQHRIPLFSPCLKETLAVYLAAYVPAGVTSQEILETLNALY